VLLTGMSGYTLSIRLIISLACDDASPAAAAAAAKMNSFISPSCIDTVKNHRRYFCPELGVGIENR